MRGLRADAKFFMLFLFQNAEHSSRSTRPRWRQSGGVFSFGDAGHREAPDHKEVPGDAQGIQHRPDALPLAAVYSLRRLSSDNPNRIAEINSASSDIMTVKISAETSIFILLSSPEISAMCGSRRLSAGCIADALNQPGGQAAWKQAALDMTTQSWS
ncbi:hypothetical protein [Pedomonas mirosovicensis]|uniref:hypothetical protein n=1 Tax=Pedomonas mirosovicensis TaxID=2908641 RepID=UPI002169963B|nr:hypothetical protein [Pedomonas mirosovicensis]MCH8685245.1 hypothetical protein [Pedomonas mirosovicensis]